MKLILTQEVAGLGAAIRWTRGGEKQISSIRRGREVREVRDQSQASGIKRELEALSVKIAVRAGGGGRLFGAVTVADIVDAVSRAGGPQVDKRRIEIGQPIKTVGVHTVTVRLHPDVTAAVSVEVVPA